MDIGDLRVGWCVALQRQAVVEEDVEDGEVEDAVWSVFESGVATKALFSVPVLWPLARIKEEVTSPMYATVPIG